MRPRCSWGPWTLITFPSSLSAMTANLSHRQTALCIPRGCKCNQTVTCAQIVPNQLAIFWMPPLDVMGWKHEQVRSISIPVWQWLRGKLLVNACKNEITLKVCEATVYAASRSMTHSAVWRCCSIQLCSTNVFPWIPNRICQIYLNKTASFFHLLMPWVR